MISLTLATFKILLCIYFNIKDFLNANLANHITTELDKIYIWLKHNKLSLIFSTLKGMPFHTSQGKTLNCYSSQ